MKKRTLPTASALVLTAILAACSDSAEPTGTTGAGAGGASTAATGTGATGTGGGSSTADNEALVIAAENALFVAKDASAVDKYFDPNILQHNPDLGSGSGPIKTQVQYLATLPSFKFTLYRTVAQDDLVMTQTTFTDAAGPDTLSVSFDLWRVAGGLLAEHWDCQQTATVDASGNFVPNPSGHTMVDGATTMSDVGQTAANEAADQSFLTTVLVQGQFSKVGQWFEGDGSNYTQHNPDVGDGLAAFGAFLMKAGPLSYTQVGKVVAQGNFVVSQAEGFLGAAPNQEHLVFYDMFRWEQDPMDNDAPKIVEHWDCIWPYVDASMTKSGLPML